MVGEEIDEGRDEREVRGEVKRKGCCGRTVEVEPPLGNKGDGKGRRRWKFLEDFL